MSAAVQIPGYVVGTWDIDPVHSDIAFVARHFVVTKVRGRFDHVEGQIVTAENPLDSTVTATVNTASINTHNEQRDGHLRTNDFLNVEEYPTLSFRSTGVRQEDGDFVLDGELTLRGVTRPVSLALELGGIGPDAYGGTRAGFTASTEILRTDYGVNFNAALETGGAVVSDKVQIALEIEAVLRQA
ncbi:YceI family protein [Solihabitans fulvus]|uniref:YceI family protein n=1 Tax=Solihabitans fulvus TaxID=1892852 RepID=A0A5B2WX85_9PSEU|nr:YceI family protein [Solihabitans fulvus]KAA2256115.1 YceI family protein [Solihabitans fulvus]